MFIHILLRSFSIYILLSKNVIGENILSFKDVAIEQGIVRGYKQFDKQYFEFLGIPYAAAPKGLNRFKAPLTANNWSGVFHANNTVVCPQDNETNEDCLVINIYTPNKENIALPVLVYIHGGAFFVGAGIKTIDVKYLIDRDIIVVTFNYRLSALGFLCLGIDEAPGNAGMKDQVAALKWIKNNINNFGGDASNVTIAGTSAGGTSVELLVLSPLSDSLFNNAIVESGCATTVWAIDFEPIETAKKVATALGYNGDFSLEELAAFYLKTDVQTLNKYTLLEFERRIDGTFGFVPCIEKIGNEAFLAEDPLDIILEGRFNHLPTLYIFVNGEGFFRERNFYNYKDKMNENFSNFLPANLHFDTDAQKLQASNKIKNFYFGNKNVSEDNLVGYINYFGDSLFIYPLVNSSQNVALRNSKNVYFLEFCYEGGLNSPKEFFSNIPMAGHVDSNNYVFAIDNVVDDNDRDIVDIMVTIWSNFIKSGSPKYPKWLPVKSDALTYLQVDKITRVLEDPYPDRMELFDWLYRNYRKRLTSIG